MVIEEKFMLIEQTVVEKISFEIIQNVVIRNLQSY